MVCASALSFLDGKICAIQEPSIVIIIIIIITVRDSVASCRCVHRAYNCSVARDLLAVHMAYNCFAWQVKSAQVSVTDAQCAHSASLVLHMGGDAVQSVALYSCHARCNSPLSGG